MSKQLAFVLGSLFFVTVPALANTNGNLNGSVREPDKFRVCGMYSTVRDQAERWTDLAAAGKCEAGRVKRDTIFSHRYVDNADNGQCTSAKNDHRCLYHSGGWEACAIYSCN